MNDSQPLVDKILAGRAKVGIIGLGYVGLPLAKALCCKGFHVAGFDVDTQKIRSLTEGRSYIKHIAVGELTADRFQATTDFRRLADMDAILICVPTPLNKNREPNLDNVLDATRAITQHLRKGQLIVLESTTYPGTTDEVMRPILESTGFKAGQDFFLAFSPEREDPNNPDFNTATTPKVVGGFTPDCLAAAMALYGQLVVKTVPVSSTKVAESTKLLENIYRAVNIALVNELKILFDRMDIDVWEVIEAAKTKPFGFHAFYPGPGLGGHCIPIDPFYLTWKAREFDFSTKFIELAGEINTNMPYFVVEKANHALGLRGKALPGAKILVLGIAYKKDIDDSRESPSLKIIQILQKMGAIVSYHDPYISVCNDFKHYPDIDLISVPLTSSTLVGMDLVMMLTDHSILDLDLVAKHADLILDTRNAFKGCKLAEGKLVKA